MRLYLTELYKLCFKKFFLAGVLFITGILLVFFGQRVNEETSTINGTKYRGMPAIKADRQITEAYEGVLTDETLQKIVDEYGFPEDFEQYTGFTDGNFLNTFVLDYASDGYVDDWDDYRPATKALPLADTDLGAIIGAVRDETGQDVALCYYHGWDAFPGCYHIAMIMVSVLILCTVSVVFANEEQIGMKALLFTTKEGPAKDTFVKIAAAFTVSAALWLYVTILALLLFGTAYGWDGLDCLTYLITGWSRTPDVFFRTYLLKMVCLSLLGTLELCAVTLGISACCRSSFRAVSIAAVAYMAPVLALLCLQGVYRALSASALPHDVLYAWSILLFNIHLWIYASPFFLVHEDILMELSSLTFRRETLGMYLFLALILITTVFSIAFACRRYVRQKSG